MQGRSRLISGAAALIILVAATIAPPGSAGAADDTAGREAAARRYLEVQPIAELLDQMAEQMSGTMGPRVRAQFEELMREFDKKLLEDAVIKSMTKNFTVTEIEALTRFYASPEGKSVMRKMGVYMADVLPVIQAQMTAAAERIRQRAAASAPGALQQPSPAK